MKQKSKNGKISSNANISRKKKFRDPKLVEYGSVREFTHAITGTMGTDGGTGAASSTMACIAPIPVVEEHRLFLGDAEMQRLYREAIFSAVKPGDVVLDLGTGSGIHAFFACQAGASKVYAIEAEGIIEAAQDAARANGFADRIEFLYGLSHELKLPEKVDVIISNVGYLGAIFSLPDAKYELNVCIALGALERMLRLAWVCASRSKAAAAFNKMGRVWRRKGDLKLALEYLNRGLELFRAAGDQRGIAGSLDDIGKSLLMLG